MSFVRTPIATLRTSRDLQPRERPLDEKTVASYVSAMRRGDPFPPIRVGRIEGQLYVVDGYHRLAAARRLGRKVIDTAIADMTWKEAVRASLEANTTHGLHLTRADKRRAFSLYVSNALHLTPEGKVKSSRTIAEELQRVISHPTVITYLKSAGLYRPEDEGDDDDQAPWGHRNPLTPEEAMDEAQSLVARLIELCDTIDNPTYLRALRSSLGNLLERVEIEARAQASSITLSLEI